MKCNIYFLYFYLLNLCKSSIIRNYINHKSNIVFNYYIDKILYIRYNDDTYYSNIKLEHNNYYFSYKLDEDEFYEDTDEIYKDLIKSELKPKMKPIMIYNNNRFNKLFYENKYKKFIEYMIKEKNKEWNDIREIVKVEERYIK